MKKCQRSNFRDCEVRAVIKFLNAEKVPGAEIHRRLSAVYGSDNIMSRRHVYKWINLFNEGRVDTHDEDRSGRPPDVLTDDAVACVRTLLQENQGYTISDIRREMATRYHVYCSRTTVFRILSQVLHVSASTKKVKISAQSDQEVKTSAQRGKEFRDRQRLLRAAGLSAEGQQSASTSTTRVRKHRERLKKLLSVTTSSDPPRNLIEVHQPQYEDNVEVESSGSLLPQDEPFHSVTIKIENDDSVVEESSFIPIEDEIPINDGLFEFVAVKVEDDFPAMERISDAPVTQINKGPDKMSSVKLEEVGFHTGERNSAAPVIQLQKMSDNEISPLKMEEVDFTLDFEKEMPPTDLMAEK